MLIRALSTMANPAFVARAGELVDLPNEVAQELIQAGAAEAVGPADIEEAGGEVQVVTTKQAAKMSEGKDKADKTPKAQAKGAAKK